MLNRLGARVRHSWPLLALWAALATTLSAVAVQVRDWFDMTDEMRYERLAIAIARTGSLVPRIHGVDIKSYSQLYPLLIAPAFRHGLVPHDLASAHFLNGIIMSSACIPAFLLARRVTGRRSAAYLVAALTISVPWIVYSSFLLTEVAAYPAFLWAVLALERTTAEPSRRHDVVAILAVALAFSARTAFIVLAIVPPLAILALELGRSTGTPWERAKGAVRRSVADHPVLAAAYALLVAGGLALIAAGEFSRVYGVYGGYGASVDSNLFPHGFARAFAEHLATFSLGLAIFPVVLGIAWLLANVVRPPAERERHAFACVASVTVLAILYQATTFDLSLPSPFVHDRFIFHIAPLILIGALCAVLDSNRPRWSLTVPAAVIALGFGFGALPFFTWGQFSAINPDTPASALYKPIVAASHTLTTARVVLVLATLWLTVMFALGGMLIRRRMLSALVVAYLVIALPGLTIYMFDRLFRVNGLSSRPVTQNENGVYDWIDEAIGTTADATIVPYPVSTDWFVSERVWRDYEWWNTSIVRDAQYPVADRFEYTGIWFPKLYLRFDPETGASSVSPTRYVITADQETRFHISGTTTVARPDVTLERARMPWRLDWLSFGLYDDGWTRPGFPVRVRVFAARGQHHAVIRYITFQVHTPDPVAQRAFDVRSNEETLREVATNQHGTFASAVRVCVPARGFAEVRLTVHGSSAIPGDQRDEPSSTDTTRVGGLFVNEIAEADEVGPSCRVSEKP